jgi:flavodoxin
VLIVLLLTTLNMSAQNKTLVVYYSWSGNTKLIAENVRDVVGADIFRIEPVDAYPKDYRACCDQAKIEINKGYHPKLKAEVENIAQYDTIFIGTPNWWSTMAPPVATFLAENDFAGKTVIPFCTHGGGGKAHIFSDMKKLCPEVKLEKGYACYGSDVSSAKEQVKTWVDNL